VHDLLVGEVAVGEDHFVDLEIADVLFEVLLVQDRNPLGVPFPGELGGVAAPGDIRDLGGGEGHDLILGASTVIGVEVVKVAPGGAQDQDTSKLHDMPLRWEATR
jgi:hypothetical protein